MKKTKRFLLGTTLAGVLIATAGMGTHSWFTAETNASGSLESGVLEINNGQDIEEPLFAETKFAPSQLQYGNWVSISNTGDLDAHLKAVYTHSVDNASLEGYSVGYMAMKYTVKPGQDVYEDSKIALDNLFNGTTNERSVAKLSNVSGDVEVYGEVLSEDAVTSGEILLGEGSEDSFWQLDEGQYIDLMVGIKLEDSAGNEYQGVKYDAALKVKAKQTDNGAEYAE
ncbi:hypothetical protein ACFFIS_15395 [Virgibacillus soli]|uniref:Spore coat-associated protein N n=1 Tax=Paracerasibacillus soli TaxID=480284 RepID=A0ABU5CUY6_9BACI|nr:hypothetical protein [Virgibacillus soli]MDY0410194.1 hypothetical protein [Virgibacillus soli]